MLVKPLSLQMQHKAVSLEPRRVTGSSKYVLMADSVQSTKRHFEAYEGETQLSYVFPRFRTPNSVALFY